MARNKVLEVDLKDPDFFEDVLMKYLFTDTEIRDKVVPFLSDSKVFHKRKNALIVESIFKLQEQYDEFPSAKEVFAHISDEDAFDHLDDVLNMELGDFKRKFLMDSIETFFKKKMIQNIANELSDGVEEDDWQKSELVDKLREAYAFGFSCDIGMDVFSPEAEERMYNFYHDEKMFTPTDIKNLDKLIQGGFHNKTLTLFMAGCVAKDTRVKIRIRKH